MIRKGLIRGALAAGMVLSYPTPALVLPRKEIIKPNKNFLHPELLAPLLAAYPMTGGHGAAGSVLPATLEYTDAKHTTVDGTTFTPSDSSIGTADARRVVAILLFSHGTGTRTVSSISLGGTTPTLITTIEDDISGVHSTAWLYRRTITSGTTASFTVTFSATATSVSVLFYKVLTSTPTPTDVRECVDSDSAEDLIVPADGVGLAGVCFGASSEATWNADFSEDDDFLMEGAGRGTSAQALNAASTINISATGIGRAAFVGAAWGP